VDLHREVGHLARHLGAEQLGGRRADAPVLAADVPRRRLPHQRPARQHAGLLVGQHRLDELEVADHGAALGGRGGVGDGLVERALGGADRQRRHVHPAARERGHRGPVAGVDVAADERRRRHPDVGEQHVRGPGALLAHLPVLRPDLDARGVGGHQEHRDAGTRRVGGPGAGEHHEQVGRRRVGDEPLLAVDDPVVPVVEPAGPGLQPGRVGARPRLGQRERRDHLARGEPPEPGRLLLVGAEVHQHLPGDPVVGAEHRADRERRVAELHRQLDVLGQVEPEPAPLRRDRVPEQAHVGRLLAQVVGDGVGVGDLALARHDLGPDPVAQLRQDRLEILRGYHV
jgi:hypothetical protein